MTTAEPTPSLARRAANTPARDWLRGRISGRLDWRSAVARAALPEPVTTLITRVVRRSRLWRLEKADLAAELCAHFADGLHAGNTPEGLMQSFGSPTHATRLIRRAKKRNRPRPYRAFIHTCQGIAAILLALLLGYGALAWRFFAGEPTVARNYAAEYNETIDAIPEHDRAWPIYLETYAMLEPVPDDLLNCWPAPAPEHPRYAEALAYLERQRPVLDLAHRAALLPRLGAPFTDQLDPRIVAANNAHHPESHQEAEPPSENPMMISVLLPTLGHMRSLARLLEFDAHVAAREGDGARVAADIDTLLGIARHAGDQPTLISALVEIAIDHLAANTLAGIIHERPDLLTDDQLRALAHRVASVDTSSIAAGLAGERWMFEDMVQRIYTDDGQGGGHLTAAGLRTMMSITGPSDDAGPLIAGPSPLGPITAVLVADRASLVAKHHELMTTLEARIGTPMWEYDAQPRVTDETETLASDPMDRVRYFPLLILMPALDRAAATGEALLQRRDGVLTGIALELFRRDNGRYPDSLAELAPLYLPEIPPDRFSGEPMRFAVDEHGPRLWSVGADRNDDGGRAPATETDAITRWRSAPDAERMEAEDPDGYDGDWVLWPIVYEPITADEDDQE
ncbi:MAG: hypothetical protein IT431_07105 [Phycisphaerales bacterium]|nr:hypothetical protein [Phycisphaerales bacterium]